MISLCVYCRSPVNSRDADFCSKECAESHYKAISELVDGTTVGKLLARIAALEAELATATHSQEETVRRCADIFKKPHAWMNGASAKAAILAAHGLKEKP